MATRTLMLAILLGLVFIGHAVDVRGQSTNRAALVVSFDEGQNVAVCVSFDEEEISGYELLEQSGLNTMSEFGGMGEAICGIGSDSQQRGCDFPAQKCFCECQGADCFYWSYWRLQGGTWAYSQAGSSSTTVRNGDVDGWVWGRGTINQDAERLPPPVTFDEVCADATETPTVTATGTQTSVTSTPTFTNTPAPDSPDDTPTPIPTLTHTPTTGPTPTVTNTPFAPPTIRLFAVDRSPIAFGESVTLAWDVADSTQVLLRYPGVEEAVPAQGSRALSPEMSTQYSLVAASPMGQAEAAVTVEVNPVISAPTADPAVVAQAAADAQPTPTEPWTPLPMPTDTPMPTVTPMPAETPVPTWTETPPTALGVESSTADAAASGPAQASASTEAGGLGSLTAMESPLSSAPTVLVVPEAAAVVAQAPTAPPVVILEPVRAGSEGAVQSAGSTGADRTLLAVGLALLVGAPLLFGGIWLAIWLIWKRVS